MLKDGNAEKRYRKLYRLAYNPFPCQNIVIGKRGDDNGVTYGGRQGPFLKTTYKRYVAK
jgi:hypothetical protein